MKIYTSYFAMLRHIPKDIVPVSISLYAPPGYQGLTLKSLAPTKELLARYKKDSNEEAYTEAFSEILEKLTPDAVYHVLEKMTGGRDCVLLCYEKAGSFCHRNLVAQWMNANEYDVQEWVKT